MEREKERQPLYGGKARKGLREEVLWLCAGAGKRKGGRGVERGWAGLNEAKVVLDMAGCGARHAEVRRLWAEVAVG